MKKLNKKGFTIVELVIVIAVIAILAAVMVPTFSGVINDAREVAALQEGKAALNQLDIIDASIDYTFEKDADATYVAIVNGYIIYADGTIEENDYAFLADVTEPVVDTEYLVAVELTEVTEDWAETIYVLEPYALPAGN